MAGLVRNRRPAGSAAQGGGHRAWSAFSAEANVTLLGGLLSDAAEPIGLREHAAGVLAGLNQPDARAELAKTLPAAPARLQSAIAFGLAGSPDGAKLLLDAIETGKASARLLQERPVEFRLNQSKLPGLKERVAKLTANLPPADQRLLGLIKARQAGFSSAQGRRRRRRQALREALRQLPPDR